MGKKRRALPSCIAAALEARRECSSAQAWLQKAARTLKLAVRKINHPDWQEIASIADRLIEIVKEIGQHLPEQDCTCEPFSDCQICRNKRWITRKQAKDRGVRHLRVTRKASSKKGGGSSLTASKRRCAALGLKFAQQLEQQKALKSSAAATSPQSSQASPKASRSKSSESCTSSPGS